MKWLIVVGGLGFISILSGCCRNGPFSSAGSYGSYYPSTPYYSAPAAYTATPNPCTCNP